MSGGVHAGCMRVAVHTGFWWENLRKWNRLEELRLDENISKYTLKKLYVGRTGLIWLRIGTGGRLF
jgi:hypothetical protein